jgi:hypothetical protein
MHIRPFAVLFAFLFCLASAVTGKSADIPVTPQSLEASSYRFSVEPATTSDGWTTYQVKITAKTTGFPASSNARLAVVTKTIKRGGGYSQSVTPFEDVRVELEKADRVWNAKFTVSEEMLKKPGLSFVFETPENSDLYILKLQDFLPRK